MKKIIVISICLNFLMLVGINFAIAQTPKQQVQAPTEKSPDFLKVKPCFQKQSAVIAQKLAYQGDIKLIFEGGHAKIEGKGWKANSNIGEFFFYQTADNDFLVVPPDKYTAPAFFIKLGADGKGCTVQ